ncbi:hypothetical protein GGTG_08419 [Gaeumannomyces tritici R3-111a-1]|uniref:Non-specific serine/threonine protein kinase n=1 Tax=Gaeumannomyces tritici (strain R3-111a-1) TaxID=644352 RepID=J3P4I2_GAET3|nr:hypothetical protein GGTG_08419 [Gaeumannomyces tritici R3-111a-1]EJT74579.1 hypothetical protein GGTG_08419 [Gaeumannomyces tritici R3-111a-1]
MLLERVEGGRHVGAGDLAACSAALCRLHAMGILHDDTSRHNFLLDVEMDGLMAQLEEEMGRGSKLTC